MYQWHYHMHKKEQKKKEQIMIHSFDCAPFEVSIREQYKYTCPKNSCEHFFQYKIQIHLHNLKRANLCAEKKSTCRFIVIAYKIVN